MTQSELGEKLNYSDKSVSKWERAESLPDANVLKQLSEIFGVTVDFLLNTHNEWIPETEEKEEEHTKCNFKAITWITIIGIWTFALFLFILFWLCTFIRQPEQYQHLTFAIYLQNHHNLGQYDVNDRLLFYLPQSMQRIPAPLQHAGQ